MDSKFHASIHFVHGPKNYIDKLKAICSIIDSDKLL